MIPTPITSERKFEDTIVFNCEIRCLITGKDVTYAYISFSHSDV